jgi:hypothetical protein
MNYMTEVDALAQYDDMLREVYGDVTVCGMVMDCVEVLFTMDETAYNTGFSEYCDSMNIEINSDEDGNVVDSYGNVDEAYLGGDDDEDELAVIAADAGRVSFT